MVGHLFYCSEKATQGKEAIVELGDRSLAVDKFSIHQRIIYRWNYVVYTFLVLTPSVEMLV
ncbi:MAG: hypothetical protein AB4057_15410 [Crocosphaera sp.]